MAARRDDRDHAAYPRDLLLRILYPFSSQARSNRQRLAEHVD